MARRYYSSTAVETTLSGSISNSATSITVTALSGFPNTTPWTAILDADTASEELVEVTNVAGTTLTVTRGVDGTAAVSHNAGASFRHGVSARDFDEANDHVNDSTGVHGLGASSSVVGTTDTQTLTNKTIDIASNTLTGVAPVANPTFTGVAQFPDGSAAAPSITNTGDTDTGIFHPADNTVGITTGGTERMRIDSGGAVLVGDTVKRTYIHLNTAPMLQVNGTTNDTASIGVARYANATAGAIINLYKSRSATVGTATTVTTGDTLGIITWSGVDTGNVGRRAGVIECVAEGTIGAGIVPGRLGFYTSDDTGTSNERMRIDRNGLITGTGTSLGAWTTYTPTLGGTGWAIGDGTVAGYYCQIGKVVAFRIEFVTGSTSTYGASATPTFTLPVTARNLSSSAAQVQAYLFDTSASTNYSSAAQVNSTTTVAVRLIGTNGIHNVVSATAPFTWATGDVIRVSGTYEIA